MAERAPRTGRYLDPAQHVGFRFEGRDYEAVAGDCVASALAANDRWVLSRSFKYHRPRGVLTMAGHDANTLVQLPADPNALADRVPVTQGLVVDGQNYRGSLARDRNAIIGRFARFLPVGFYYRAFFRPRGAWNWWARLFRRTTGLGTIDPGYQPPTYDKQYLFCDVLVVGGGANGMRAALEAAAAGRDVVLVDRNPVLGGALNYRRIDVNGVAADPLRETLTAAVAAEPEIRVLSGATANGWFADNWVPIVQGRRLYKLRAAGIVLCPGVIEQHAVFRNNDLPGVMMGGAAQRLWRLYGVQPGRRAVVLTGNEQGYAVALDLLDAGVQVAAVVELRPLGCTSAMADEVRRRAVPVRNGETVFQALPNDSGDHLAGVEVRQIVADGECAGNGARLECDLLCMSVGVMPAWQLACQAGAQLQYDDETASFDIVDLPPGMTMRSDDPAAAANFPWPIFPHPDGKEFVDFDEDLQIADILNAVADGYEHIELVKRFSTCGMGPSQGRHSALPTARLVARHAGRTVGETGVTTARPPVFAETLGHCAGRSFYPARRSSMHYRHLEAGAQWLQAGDWYRPAFYASQAEMYTAVQDEARQVRRGVGMVDISTLGGLDIRGPDAGEFLNRLYTMLFSTVPVGRARYALMTNEAGVVIDDGVACRFADDHFYVTATTGGVTRVFQTMLKWQRQWSLDVDIANVTSAWCGVNVAGPQARALLRQLCSDVALSGEEFPYMGVREGHVAGIPARLVRVGFVGEPGYEIHVPQHCGEALWDAVVAAGQVFGIRPFGIEAQRLLRLEKGHVIVGQDTDAMTNPLELDMQWALSKKKRFFLGKRTLDELAKRPLKRRLAGFVIRDPAAPVPKESHLVIEGEAMVGRVTSAGFSGTLGYTIGLAYVPPDAASIGARLRIRCDDGAMADAEVVSLPFYDPDNTRQNL